MQTDIDKGLHKIHLNFYKCPHLLILNCGFVKDVIHSNHLGKNGAIAERVAQCSQPGSDIAQCSHNLWVSGGDNEEVCIHVQDDGPAPYQVVQVGAAQTYQPVRRRTQPRNIPMLDLQVIYKAGRRIGKCMYPLKHTYTEQYSIVLVNGIRIITYQK